jgi:hypothetical protein
MVYNIVRDTSENCSAPAPKTTTSGDDERRFFFFRHLYETTSGFWVVEESSFEIYLNKINMELLNGKSVTNDDASPSFVLTTSRYHIWGHAIYDEHHKPHHWIKRY